MTILYLFKPTWVSAFKKVLWCWFKETRPTDHSYWRKGGKKCLYHDHNLSDGHSLTYCRKLRFEKISFYPDGALGKRFGSYFKVEKQQLRLFRPTSTQIASNPDGKVCITQESGVTLKQYNTLWDQRVHIQGQGATDHPWGMEVLFPKIWRCWSTVVHSLELS